MLLARLSLRLKVMGLLLVLSLAPLLVAGGVNVHRAVERGKQAEQARYSLAAQSAAQAFGDLARRARSEARTLAQRFPAETVDFDAALRARAKGERIPVDVDWTEADLIHQLNDAEITTVLAAKDGRVLQTVPFRNVGDIHIGDLLDRIPPGGGLLTGHLPPLTDSRWPALVAISPVVDGDEIAGWVVLFAHGTRLHELVVAAARDLKAVVGVFDEAGRQVVLSQEEPDGKGDVLQWTQPTAPHGAREEQRGPEEWLVAWAQVPGAPLVVQMRVQASTAYRHVYVLIWLLIAVIVLTLVLVFFFADYLASVLLRPIHELEQGAKMIGSGALHHRIRVDGHQHDELGRLANAFNSMGESLQTSGKKISAYSRSLESAREELDALVDGIATDLKKSLRTVEAFASFLQEDYGRQLGEDGAGLVRGVLSNIGRIERFADDITRLVHREKMRGDASRFSLGALLEEVKAQVLSQHAGVVLIEPNLPEIHADRAQLVMLFDNLIVNGLKFNRSDPPTVSITCVDDVLDWRIEVTDNGIGIAPDNHQQIFELFSRLHRHHEFAGTGTGLNLARRIVEDHRGTISVESTLGEGATFVVTLPKRPQMLTLPGIRI